MARISTPRSTLAGLRQPLVLALLFAVGSSQAASGWMEEVNKAIGEQQQASSTLPAGDVAGGLKEALQVGTERVVARLGQRDGFNLDPAIHIPLPHDLEKVRDLLSKVGMDSILSDLEARLNRAAELATPKAKDLFVNGIGDLTLDDAGADPANRTSDLPRRVFAG